AFVAAAQQLSPRYAVPFASGVCHLHREVMDENRFLVTAPEMRTYFESHAKRVPKSKLQIMPVGSRWSSDSGFELTENVVEDIVAYSQARAQAESERLEKTYRNEAAKEVAFDDFHNYFNKFFKATWPLRPFLRNARWVFPIEKPQAEYWCVDFGKGAIERSAQMPKSYDSIVTVSPAVLSGSLRTASSRTWTFRNAGGCTSIAAARCATSSLRICCCSSRPSISRRSTSSRGAS
ncbi:MAG TPA: hypothetical protein VEW74_09220, partial [Candidatus Nitrosotalea sp.]|nr:hypothetical protein [Candidatus Nitrosotalea sp.]